MALPDLADLKPHVNIAANDTSYDEELQHHLDAAIEIVAGMVGPLESGAVTETHRGVNSRLLVLRQMPVTSLTSISLRYATGEESPLTLSEYELDTETGIVRLASGGPFYGTYVVEYDAGRASLPASIRLAILIIAAHLWETQRMPMLGDVNAPVGFGGGVDAAMPTSRGFALPNRALELLRPYVSASLA